MTSVQLISAGRILAPGLLINFPPLFAVILHQAFQDREKWEYVSERVDAEKFSHVSQGFSPENMEMFISIYMPLYGPP